MEDHHGQPIIDGIVSGKFQHFRVQLWYCVHCTRSASIYMLSRWFTIVVVLDSAGGTSSAGSLRGATATFCWQQSSSQV